MSFWFRAASEPEDVALVVQGDSGQKKVRGQHCR